LRYNSRVSYHIKNSITGWEVNIEMYIYKSNTCYNNVKGWATGQPQDNGEHCAAFATIHGFYCTNDQYAICEREYVYFVTTTA